MVCTKYRACSIPLCSGHRHDLDDSHRSTCAGVVVEGDCGYHVRIKNIQHEHRDVLHGSFVERWFVPCTFAETDLAEHLLILIFKELYTLCTLLTACVHVLDAKLCLSILVVLTVLPVAIPVVSILISPFH